MSEQMSDYDFACKVEWEDGVAGALEYGLRVEHLREDSVLREVWQAAQDAYPAIEAADNLIQGFLEDAEEEESEEDDDA